MFTELRPWAVAMEAKVCVHVTTTVDSGYGSYSSRSLSCNCG